MKVDRLKKLIKEQLNSILQESKKRYVATINFYVYADNENYANKEVQEIINMIDEKYDNNPSLIDLKPQQFGKLNIGENINTQTLTDLTKVTRLVVINHNSNIKSEYGRIIDISNLNGLKSSLQDNGKTLKIFIKEENNMKLKKLIPEIISDTDYITKEERLYFKEIINKPDLEFLKDGWKMDLRELERFLQYAKDELELNRYMLNRTKNYRRAIYLGEIRFFKSRIIIIKDLIKNKKKGVEPPDFVLDK